MQSAHPRLTGIARRIVETHLLDAKVAQEAQDQAKRQHKNFIRYLAEEKLLPTQTIAAVVCEDFGIPLLDLDALAPETIAQLETRVPETLIRQHQVLPLSEQQQHLFIAVADPTSEALEEIKFQTGMSIEPIIVAHDKLQAMIESVLAMRGYKKLERIQADIGAESGQNEGAVRGVGTLAIDEAPAVRFVNKMLLAAIQNCASDIHFEPYEQSYRVRFRIDGILHEITNPPPGLGNQLASRLKVMANLDISERRLPQDGRIRIKHDDQQVVDFRINTLPTLWGEKVMLRLLDAGASKIGIHQLGFDEEQKASYLAALNHPQGMILVTGPTGSGKTVTLYAGLNLLNTPNVNISTVEDPVEINLTGINQVHVNLKAGLGFATALQAFLRQDPDILMIGEIRDPETAEIAVKAAQTGHRVLSTLHTNRAVETLDRLRNLGISDFNLATSISLIMAQRLARCLCEKCKKITRMPTQTLLAEGFSESRLDGLTLFEPSGCSQCTDGYKGRISIHEVLPVSEALTEIIMIGGNVLELSRQATREGFRNLRQSALKKVELGLTSLTEANRIIY